jgi:predicted permease
VRIEHWIYTLPLRIRSLFQRTDVEQELDDEIRDHIERQTAANISAGMSTTGARTAALREFGGVERRKEEVRETRGVSLIEQCMQDFSYAIRCLRRSPGFTAATVLTLGLGIGVSSAAFSLINRLVLHPLPFAAGDRLVLVFMHDAKSDVSMSANPDAIGAWQQSAKSFDEMAVIGRGQYFLTDSTHAFTTGGSDASPSLLSILDIVPVVGRNLLPSDTVVGAPRVAMLGELLWRREFGGRPEIVGRSVQLNDTLVTIVGVAPTQLNALMIYQPVGLWTPVSASRALTVRRSSGMNVIARMRPGVTETDAQRELQDLDDRVRHDAGRPARTASSEVVRLARPSDFLGTELHVGLWIAFGATGLVLLIACANVANLQLVRMTRRAGELAVRRALGASSSRLARQLIIESGALTLFGTAAGVLLGSWILRAVVVMRPEQMRQLTVVRFDWAAVGFAVAAAMISSLVFAVAPAWRQGTAALADGLRISGAHSTARRRWLQPVVVSGEIALSLILLMGAGLLVRSFVRMQRVDPGYVAEDLIEFSVTLRGAHFPDSLARDEFWRQFLPRVRAIPGVAAISVPVSLPSERGWTEADSLEVEGRQFAPGEGHVWLEDWRYSGADFRVLENRVLQGRVFGTEDERGETDAVVIGQSAARDLWPGTSAIGKRLRVHAGEPWHTVVGVVADQGAVTGPVRTEPRLQLFFPTSETRLHRRRGLLVRVASGVNVESVLANMTFALHGMDRTIPITLSKSEVAMMHDERAGPRFVTMILTVFAGLALFLACFGLYGVISYAVSQRVHELGVRMALGAESTDVIRLVLGSGLRLALAGAVIGIAASIAATRVLRGMLYGVSPLDPTVFVVMPAILMAVALFATYLPAHRAARANPMEALRAE